MSEIDDEERLTPRQINRILRTLTSGRYPISEETRKKVVDEALNILKHSDSARDKNAAISNILRADRHNLEVRRQEQFDDSMMINLARLRQQLLDDDSQIARLRDSAGNGNPGLIGESPDEGLDGTVADGPAPGDS